MSTLRIIGAPQSNFVWTARIVAAEKGVPYALEPMFPHTPAIQAVHPLGKIPGMRHGETALGESRAICLYIDRVFPGPSLVPDDPAQAARVEQWASMICTHFDLLLMRQYAGAYFFADTPDGAPDRARIDPLIDPVRRQIQQLDGALADAPYLCGDAFTLADAYLAPILFYMDALPESSAAMTAGSTLRAYLGRCLQRPSVESTIPPPMPARQQRAAS